MSAIDIARDLSVAMIPASQSLKESLALSENDDDAAFAVVSLYAHSKAHACTVVVCLSCCQAFVGDVPSWCACGAPLTHDADSQATNRVLTPRSDTAFIAMLPTRYLAERAVDYGESDNGENDFVWPPWAIPPSIVGGSTLAPLDIITSPYVSAVQVVPPPPPPPQVFLSHYHAATHQNDSWLVIALCLLLIGFVCVLRLVLAL